MLKDKAARWDDTQTVAERIQMCISMLYIHGYISPSTRDKAHARLLKQYEKEAKEAK